MSTTIVSPELDTPRDSHDGGRGGFADGAGGGDGGGSGGSRGRRDLYWTAVWVLLIPVVMIFMGLTSAMVVRRGVSNDWVGFEMPPILGWNTLVLLASSATLELARRHLGKDRDAVRNWLCLTGGLGFLFLGGQVLGWNQLAQQGLFLSTNPSSSFFYVLTATHAVHLVGAVAALCYLAIQALRGEWTVARTSALRATAVYWHFMDALWIYLLILMVFWR